jgi:hypothetical protein
MGQFSPDGKWWWNGQDWIPAPDRKSKGWYLRLVGGVAATFTALGAVLGVYRFVSDNTLQPTPSQSPAAFQLAGQNFTGECTASVGCPVAATFKNTGGTGSGQATFTIVSTLNGQALGECTTTIPKVDAGGNSSASCTVESGALGTFVGEWVNANGPGPLPLRLEVKVQP